MFLSFIIAVRPDLRKLGLSAETIIIMEASETEKRAVMLHVVAHSSSSLMRLGVSADNPRAISEDKII